MRGRGRSAPLLDISHSSVLRTCPTAARSRLDAQWTVTLPQEFGSARWRSVVRSGQRQAPCDAIAAAVDKRPRAAQEDSEAICKAEGRVALQQELHDLQGVRNELQGEVTATKKKQMAELQPRIDEIEASLAEGQAQGDAAAAAGASRRRASREAIALRNSKLETEGEKQLTTCSPRSRASPTR